MPAGLARECVMRFLWLRVSAPSWILSFAEAVGGVKLFVCRMRSGWSSILLLMLNREYPLQKKEGIP